jgi:pyridoxal phosphate enzyme (YggS family)
MAEHPKNTTSTHSIDIGANLEAARKSIAAATAACGREPHSVDLVAVSKTQSIEAVRLAIRAGQSCFGENRVQEAEGKFSALKRENGDLELHLIGPLQTNKASTAVRLFDVIETLDRPKLARSLAKEMAKSGRRPACFVQVNTGEEPQKAGVLPGDADALIALARDELALPVVGLMCIPPFDEPSALHYALLAEIARRNGLKQLSMGMSHDFETAIKLGATQVRVGTAIFGPRRSFAKDQ